MRPDTYERAGKDALIGATDANLAHPLLTDDPAATGTAARARGRTLLRFLATLAAVVVAVYVLSIVAMPATPILEGHDITPLDLAHGVPRKTEAAKEDEGDADGEAGTKAKEKTKEKVKGKAKGKKGGKRGA